MSSRCSSQTTKQPKQTTLLQTWGYAGNETVIAAGASQSGCAEIDAFAGDENEDDDEILNRALEASMAQFSREKSVPQSKQPPTSTWKSNRQSTSNWLNNSNSKGRRPSTSSLQSLPTNSRASLSNTSLPDPVNFEEVPVIPQATPLEQLPGFDLESGRTWIYPTNYPVRKYQFDIVRSCLFQNTLVTLPTGLGKTFIAAVVMYNFYRWYPQGRIVFMAPTKPLVAQQIEACFKIMGVPQIDMSEMTGNVAVNIRKEAWKQKRIFFLTPQVMSNDLSRSLFPANEVKLLVIDEAHRAQGDYAYCQVIKELTKSKSIFRVVALSATPGSDLNAVRLVLQNLQISNIELRNEESPDIVPYTFQRSIEKVVVPLGNELKKVKMDFLSILEPFIRRLAKLNILSRNSIDPTHYTKFGLLQSRNEFRQNPPAALDMSQRGAAEGDYASAISLYHAYDLLLQHGMRTFYNFVSKVTGEGEQIGGHKQGSTTPSSGINRRLRYDLNRNQTWQNLMSYLRAKFSDDSNNTRLNTSGPKLWSQFGGTSATQTSAPLVLGHPKLEKLRDMVLQHFRNKEEEKIATRVMIFSQYRDSVQEITACLHAFKPLIKVMEFVGQAGTKGKRGLTQKEQIEVVKRFREGGYNTLVATCVGEEGLDIGEIDLIVCYDVSKSPIRLVQRMGRTGRKRAGRIIVLVTEGKEEQTYNQSMYSKNSINKAILEKNKLTAYLSPSPRMVPRGLEPVCHKMIMNVVNFVQSKSGQNAIAGNNNRRISGMFERRSLNNGGQRGATFRENSGFLSSEELQYWNEHFCLDQEMEAAVPVLKERKEIWNLTREQMCFRIANGNGDSEKIRHEFDLSEWILWQSAQQNRYIVSPSSTGKLFTDLNGFISMHRFQRKVSSQDQGPVNLSAVDDDFGYGAEMAAWLNDQDVVHVTRPEKNVRRERSQTPILRASQQQPRLSSPHRSSTSLCLETSLHLNVDPDGFDEDLCPSPEKRLTEEEKAILEILGPASMLNLDFDTPPAMTEQFLSSLLPNKAAILSFDICSYWRKLEEQTFGKKCRSSLFTNIELEVSSPPLSPVISTVNDFRVLLKNVAGNKTSTPLVKNSADRKFATKKLESVSEYEPSTPQVRKSLDSENYFDVDDEFFEAVLCGQHSAAEQVTSEKSLSKTVDASSSAAFLEAAAQAVSFQENAASAKAKIDAKEKSVGSDFEDDLPENFFDSAAAASSEQNCVGQKVNDSSLFSATQLVSLLDKSVKSKTFVNSSFSDEKSRLPDVWCHEKVVVQNKNCKTLLLPSDRSSVGEKANAVLPKVSSGEKTRLSNEHDSTNSGYSLDDLPPMKFGTEDQNVCVGEMDLFSDFDLGSPELKTGSPECCPDSPILRELSTEFDCDLPLKLKPGINLSKDKIGPEFKFPNLEDFELRSKTPKKILPHAAKVRLDQSSITKSSTEKSSTSTAGCNQPSAFKSSSHDVSTGKSDPCSVECSKLDESLETSPIVVRRKTKGVALLLSSSEDENEHSPEKTKSSLKSCKDKRRVDARQFFEVEAELSDQDNDTVSSDESEAASQDFDASFVDDCTQKVGIDQQAMYLRSIKSPLEQRRATRPPPPPMRREDIYSQFQPDSEMMDGDDTVFDSFVVDNSVVEYVSSLDELDMVDEFESDVEPTKKSRLKRKKGSSSSKFSSEDSEDVTSSQPRKKTKKKYSQKKKKRIFTADSSSSDHDEEIVILSQHKEPEWQEKLAKKQQTNVKPQDCQAETQSKVVESPPAARLGAKNSDNDPTTSQKGRTHNPCYREPSQVSQPKPSDGTIQNELSFSSSQECPTLGQSMSETCHKRSILVGASDIHKSVELISDLKHRFNFEVVVRSGLGVSFLLSQRLGVQRISCKDFANGGNRAALLQQCQKMNDLFDRPCLIIETERPDNPDVKRAFSGGFLEQHGGIHRTKYVDMILAQLSQSKFQILFSGSQVETARVLSALAAKESRKGFCLPCPFKLTANAEKALSFYQSLPGIGFGSALILSSQFKSPKDVISAAQATLMRKIGLDEIKARRIREYCKTTFTPGMTEAGFDHANK